MHDIIPHLLFRLFMWFSIILFKLLYSQIQTCNSISRISLLQNLFMMKDPTTNFIFFLQAYKVQFLSILILVLISYSWVPNLALPNTPLVLLLVLSTSLLLPKIIPLCIKWTVVQTRKILLAICRFSLLGILIFIAKPSLESHFGVVRKRITKIALIIHQIL